MAVQGNLFIERIYQQIEFEMLQNVGKVLGSGKGVDKNGVTQWRVAKLSQLGTLRTEQLKVIAKYSGLTVEEVTKYIQELGEVEIEAFEDRNPAFNEAGMEYKPPSDSLYNRLVALEKQSKDVMNMVNTNMLTFSEQAYIDILTQASAEVLTGNSTLYQSLTKSATEWAEKGIPAIVDKANKVWSTEAYISMVLRATQKNVVNQVQEGRMDDYDIDLVEFSSHAGSRPSHVEFQGKIYSRSGKSKKYPPRSETTYGIGADGMVTGIGCGHVEYAYIEGVSTKRYEPYNKKESEEVYKEAQKQRYLEREIRRAKKELAMLEAMEAEEDQIKAVKAKIRQKQTNMRTFIENTGRTRRRQREQIV